MKPSHTQSQRVLARSYLVHIDPSWNLELLIATFGNHIFSEWTPLYVGVLEF